MPALPVMGETEIDGCVRASSQEKLASGIVVYLMEELGDARLRTAQLKKYIQEALDLVEKSPERDRIFEIAGHLLHGIPDVAFKLDKALDAAALAAARLDYEEIKQNLKPEKADELEDVLQDVRLQYLKRRSKTETVMAGDGQNFVGKTLRRTYEDGRKDPAQDPGGEDEIKRGVTEATNALHKLAGLVGKPSPLGSPMGIFNDLGTALEDVAWYLGASHHVAEKTADVEKEAGKAQDHLMKQIHGMRPGQEAPITDLARGYLGHFKEVMRAAGVLAAKGIIDYDGVTVTKKKDAPMKNAKEAADELETLAKITETEGKIPLARLARLIGALEGQGRTAGDVPKKATAFFRNVAATIRKETNPSRVRLASVLRRVFADGMQMDAGTMLAAIYAQANSREDVIKGFMSANPNMSKEDAEKAADMWEKHQNVVKDKHQ